MYSLAYPQSLAVPSVAVGATLGLSMLAPIGWGNWLVLMLAGLASWTLLEYLLHRFVLHGVEPFKRWHLEHHLHPDRPMKIPLAFSLILVGALGIPAVCLGAVASFAVAFSCGLSVGLFLQEVVHHRLHSSARPAGGWLRLQWNEHDFHHHRDQGAAFGTLTGFWDWFFHTASPRSY